MILNGNTGSHDFYQPDRPQRKPGKALQRSPTGFATRNCAGPLEDKLAWMRRRQAMKKVQGRSRSGKS